MPALLGGLAGSGSSRSSMTMLVCGRTTGGAASPTTRRTTSAAFAATWRLCPESTRPDGARCGLHSPSPRRSRQPIRPTGLENAAADARRQAAQASAPTCAEIAQVLVDRLVPFPRDGGLDSVDAIAVPVDAEEADRHRIRIGQLRCHAHSSPSSAAPSPRRSRPSSRSASFHRPRSSPG